jgi:hypothetical protein
MQEYSEDNIFERFDDLLNLSRKVTELLTSDNNFDDSGDISKLYSLRKQILENLKKFADSKKGLKFIEENADTWNRRRDESIELEKKNIELLKTLKTKTGNQLKELNNNRSVLVYSKAEKS